MESLSRDNSKLVVDEFLPCDWTVSRHQMCLPLIDQAEIPDDKEKRDRDQPERCCSRARPQPGGPCETGSKSQNKDRCQRNKEAIAESDRSVPPRKAGD